MNIQQLGTCAACCEPIDLHSHRFRQEGSPELQCHAQAASPKAGVMRPSVRPLMKLLQPGGEAPHRNQGLAAITLRCPHTVVP